MAPSTLMRTMLHVQRGLRVGDSCRLRQIQVENVSAPSLHKGFHREPPASRIWGALSHGMSACIPLRLRYRCNGFVELRAAPGRSLSTSVLASPCKFLVSASQL